MNKNVWIICVSIIICFGLAGCSSQQTAIEIPDVDAYIEDHEYEKAVIQLDKYITDGTYSPQDLYYYYGVCYNRLELYDLASRNITNYQAKHKDIKGKYEKMISFYGNGAYETAITEFEKMGQEMSDNAEYFYYYGRCYYKEEDYESAQPLFQKAVLLEPDNYDYTIALLDAYSYTEKYTESIALCTDYIEKTEKMDDNEVSISSIRYQLANSYYQTGQYQAAADIYSGLVKESSEPDYEWYYIAQCYAQMGDFKNTYEYLEKCVDYTVDDYGDYYLEECKSDEVFEAFLADETYSQKIKELETSKTKG